MKELNCPVKLCPGTDIAVQTIPASDDVQIICDTRVRRKTTILNSGQFQSGGQFLTNESGQSSPIVLLQQSNVEVK